MQNRLIIMQGKPGCGKSWIADAIQSWHLNTDPRWIVDGKRLDAVIVSADTYLWDEGKYVWTPERGVRAHQKAQNACLRKMDLQTSLIIIDNTNLKYKWAAAYFKMAKHFNYSVQVVRVEAECNLQKQQNKDRGDGRTIPLEAFENIATEDILTKYFGVPFLVRLRVVWQSLLLLAGSKQNGDA